MYSFFLLKFRIYVMYKSSITNLNNVNNINFNISFIIINSKNTYNYISKNFSFFLILNSSK